MVEIRLASIKGMEDNHSLYVTLIRFLRFFWFIFLKDIHVNHLSNLTSNSWLDSWEIGLSGSLVAESDMYILQLSLASIYLSHNGDPLSWYGWVYKDKISVEEIYSHIS